MRARRRILPLLAFLAFLWMAPATEAASYVEPTASRYESSTASETSEGTRLEVKEPPGGLFLTYSLEPSKRYRVRLSGEALAGATALRVRDTPGRTTYQWAPDGSLTFTVAGITELELLYYSDSSAEYLIHSATVEECPDCRTGQDLRAEILSHVPGLEQALERDRYEAAKLILAWAARRIPFVLPSPAPLDTVRTSPADLWYENFEALRGGVFCSGAAEFLQQVLTLFDIDAFTLDFGDSRDSLTHALVVVPVREGDGWRHYLLDPTFDLSFEIAPSGRDVNLLVMLELLRMNATDRIRPVTGDLSSRMIIHSGGATPCGPDGGPSTACSLDAYFEGWAGLLRRNGYRTDVAAVLELILKQVFEAGPSLDPAAREHLLDRLDAFRAGETVATVPMPPKALHPPRLGGDPTVGTPLWVSPGEWQSDAPITRTSYAWFRCDDDGDCERIAGASKSTYRIAPSDAGFRMRASVTAVNENGASDPATVTTDSAVQTLETASTEVGSRPRALRALGRPMLSGRAKVGGVLRCRPPRWRGRPRAIRYRWLRDGGPIPRSTRRERRLRGVDRGRYVACRVTAIGASERVSVVSRKLRVGRGGG